MMLGNCFSVSSGPSWLKLFAFFSAPPPVKRDSWLLILADWQRSKPISNRRCTNIAHTPTWNTRRYTCYKKRNKYITPLLQNPRDQISKLSRLRAKKENHTRSQAHFFVGDIFVQHPKVESPYFFMAMCFKYLPPTACYSQATQGQWMYTFHTWWLKGC